jgi:putative peptidoglycan lipid II flippase
MGVFAISLGVVVFPLLSRYASRNDMPNFRTSLNRAIRLAMMEGFATGVGLFVLAEPIVALLWRHGRFSEGDMLIAAFILRMYVIGMWAYCTHQILTRAFYSMKDTKTPLKVQCSLAAVYMVLAFCLIWSPQVGPGAFGLTASITFSANVAILLWILRRRVGRFGGRQIVLSAARSLIASLAMAAVLVWVTAEISGATYWGVPPMLHGLLHLGPLPRWLIVAVGVPVGAAVFMLAARLMHAPELGEFFGALKRRPVSPD